MYFLLKLFFFSLAFNYFVIQLMYTETEPIDYEIKPIDDETEPTDDKTEAMYDDMNSITDSERGIIHDKPTPGLEFHAMALGHSGILIYWDPIEDNELFRQEFFFQYHAAEGNTRKSDIEQEFITHGQYKLNSLLDEDTEYEITISEALNTYYLHDNKNLFKKNFTVKCKTALKNNAPPEKPFFKWDFYRDEYFRLGIEITWIPCGQERNCKGNEAGTHFAVKYKILESRKIVTVVQNSSVYQKIPYIYVGKIYEITVTSINGDSEISSDPQEIFQMPCSSPVHSVRGVTLTNSSIYISWKKPKQFTRKDQVSYIVSHDSIGRIDELHWKRPSNQNGKLRSYEGNDVSPYRILDDFKLRNMNTFTIIPNWEECDGLGFRFDYSIQVNQLSLPLAKPDFDVCVKYDVLPANPKLTVRVRWIPCAEISECKNMSPGSGFELIIQCDNFNKTFMNKGIALVSGIKISRTETCKSWGRSVDEFNQSSDIVEIRFNPEEIVPCIP